MQTLNSKHSIRSQQRFTQVMLLYLHQRINVWLRFGIPVDEIIHNRVRRVMSFAPGAVFCRVHWEANSYGTTLWRLAIMQAGDTHEAIQHVVGVRPGAQLLLEVSGARNVQRVLTLIDTIEAQAVDPTTVAPAYWRTVHNRLAARHAVPAYNSGRRDANNLRESLS